MESTSQDIVLSVVVPAYNESENLQILLPRLHSALAPLGRSVEIIIVNNASTDSTDDVINGFKKEMPEVRLVHESQLGYGRAVLAGLKETRGTYIGIIRSDNQEKSEDLYSMFVVLKDSKLDIYKAIRGHRINDGALRVVVSFFYNTLFKIFFGLKSRDLNATPKIFTHAFYDKAHLESKDWFLDAEIVIKAEKMGYTVGQMEIEYLPRLKGKSSVRPRHVFEFLNNMLQWHSRMVHGKLLEE